MKSSLGLDLAALDTRATGVAILYENMGGLLQTLFTDDQIMGLARERGPDIIAIDAPLSIPRGRRNIDDRDGPHYRRCDLELRKLGIKFFPITLGPMRALTKRGIKLASTLSEIAPVIESYPGGAQDLMQIPRNKDINGLKRGLSSLGLMAKMGRATKDELDALTIAYVGLRALRKEALVIGDPSEGVMYL